MRHPEHHAAVLLFAPHGHRPDLLLQDKLELAAGDEAFVREHPGGADRGMAGERHLDSGCEDADLRSVGRIVRRQDESRLGEVQLARDALHQLGGEAFAVEHYRELVAGQGLLGEDVDDADLMLQARAIRHVVVPCARSLPESMAINLPSAVAIVPPRWITTPSQRTRPVSTVMGRTKLVLTSSVV